MEAGSEQVRVSRQSRILAALCIARHPERKRTNEVTVACIISLVGFLGLASGCNHNFSGEKAVSADERPLGKRIKIDSPLGLPAVPIPPNNPATAQTVTLGRELFYERKLSRRNAISCAFCHNPSIGFTDVERYSRGASGTVGTRNAPTVLNAAFVPFQFWDGRAQGLEEQVGAPMANAVEMDQAHDLAVSKLEADPIYRARFEKSFGPGPITMGKIGKAIASFERTLLSGNSPFDKYRFGGDKSALSPSGVRGLAIFQDRKRGNCATCHAIDQKFALFTDGKFHNIGVGVTDDGQLTDLGRYYVTRKDSDKGAFKTPTLRNVALSAPYMHDGSLKTLKDVVDFYAGGGNSNPYLDKEIRAIKLSGSERADLVDFLKSLTGDMPPNAGPPEDPKHGAGN